MLWFFDSWLGGLTALRAFLYVMPDVDTVYFADQKNCPYGEKTQQEIREYTRAWTQWLFDHGAEVVILACNTATAHAIRWLQQDIFPDRTILGVTIPGAERVVESGYRHIGVLATESSVRIWAYSERVHILDSSVVVEEIAMPHIVPLIESGIFSGEHIDRCVDEACSQFSDSIEALVLGCTHYPLIISAIARRLSDLPIIDPARESARKFISYLERHPKIKDRLTFNRKSLFSTSGEISIFEERVHMLFVDFPDFFARDSRFIKN